jgi:type IV secretory pathway VirB3-like protein
LGRFVFLVLGITHPLVVAGFPLEILGFCGFLINLQCYVTGGVLAGLGYLSVYRTTPSA